MSVLLLPKPQRLHRSPEMAASLLTLLLASVTLVTAQAVNQGDQGCEDDWTQFGSRCFRFYNLKSSWMDAENACLQDGANLASIHSLEENTFIGDLINEATGSNTRTWLGGHDAVVNNRWIWSDGTPWDFEQWFTNEPNNMLDGREEGLMMNYHDAMTWNDFPQNKLLPYVCAKDSAQPPPKTLFLTLDDTSYQCTPDV